MRTKNTFAWKTAIGATIILALIFLGAGWYIKSNKEFPVVHFQEVKSEVDPVTGRAAAGSPEIYQIQVSPAYTWNMTKSNTATFRTIGWVFLILAAAFITIQSMDTWDLGKSGSNIIAYSMLVIALSFYIAAYSSALVSNYVEVTKVKYEEVKDDPAKIEQLFKDRDYIR